MTTARRATIVGLAGAVAILAGGAWYQALTTPPYLVTDEHAHAGYVLAVQGGDLPTIDTPIDGRHGGEALRDRLEIEPERRREVWVANNPPLVYFVAAGPAAATRALGLPGGPLLGLRLLNAAATAGAVALTFRLARRLAGDDPLVGLVAAGLLAALPHLGYIASLGLTDGPALLATTGVLAALAKVAIGPADRWSVASLGLWCAAAAAVRPMSLVFAMAGGLAGLAIVAYRRERPLAPEVGWLVLPTVISSGWAYALNVVRYGDPTASSALFEKFQREPNGSIWSNLGLWRMWTNHYRTMVTRRIQEPLATDPLDWGRAASAISLLATAVVVGLLVRAVIRRPRHERHGRALGSGLPSAAGSLPLLAWAVTGAVSLVPYVLLAQHRSGGGGPHPRYLFGWLPFAATVVALGVVRVAGRWGGAVVIALLAALTVRQGGELNRWVEANPTGPAGSQLVAPIAQGLAPTLGLAAATVGFGLLAAALLAAPWTYRPEDPADDDVFVREGAVGDSRDLVLTVSLMMKLSPWPVLLANVVITGLSLLAGREIWRRWHRWRWVVIAGVLTFVTDNGVVIPASLLAVGLGAYRASREDRAEALSSPAGPEVAAGGTGP